MSARHFLVSQDIAAGAPSGPSCPRKPLSAFPVSSWLFTYPAFSVPPTGGWLSTSPAAYTLLTL